MSPATLSNGGNLEYEKDIEARFETSIEALLHEQLHPSRVALDRERDLDIYRSGSAPPTVEGSRTAVGRLFGHAGAPEAGCRDTMTAEEMRSHPEYLSYKYSKNLNPRLPHPMSQEHRGAAQRHSAGLPSFGGIGDRRRREEPGDGGQSWSSLFSVQPGLSGCNGDGDSAEQISRTLQSPPQQPSAAWLEPGNDGLIGLPGGVKLGARSKSFADALREDFGRSASSSGHLSSPISHNAFNNIVDPLRLSDVQVSQVTHLPNHMGTVDGMHSGATPNGLVRVQSLGSTMPHSFASSLNSRNTTPEPQLIVRSSSPCLPPVVGRVCDMDRTIVSDGFGSVPSSMTDVGDTTIALSGMKLTDKVIEDGHNHVQGQSRQVFADHHKLQFNMPGDERQYIRHNIVHKAEIESSVPSIPLQVYSDLSKRISVHKSLATGSPAMSSSPLDAGVAEGKYFNRSSNQVGSGRQVPNVDYLYAQYRQRADSGRQSPASLNDPSLGRNYIDTSLIDFQYQDEYLEAFLAQQKLQYDASFSGKSAGFNSRLYDNPAFGLGTPYPSPLSGSVISSLGPESFLRQNDRSPHFPPILRCAAGGSKGSLNHENGIMQGGFVSSLLEELKNSRARSFELSEIVGHVVEFSADQYGSRFIQQKLETASAEEKNYIFPEVLPHALVLMTDVFGNYVIQKFFEHGTESQRNQLADQLMGYVLPLSLQMYGCRVIQKALEVLDVDQQTWMVSELDGSIMKCVRDQNGNHVIQKCIECVPQERIQFIISSFYGQVVALSTHPYGCRVIQRVLEHCNDAKTQGIMIDEIMHSVSALAQDQYGNYVVQHVLQHGKREERSAIVRKLAGQIVKMSQQKFASNVVEKCLSYGTPEERQLLINEILGSTDENEPLQAMMKDQFGNYVVQKVLEICDDQNRELILSRIKVHVNALKKYTYGKHIVARVEKLIATGERCIAMSPFST